MSDGNGVDVGHAIAMMQEMLTLQHQVIRTLDEHSETLNQHTGMLNQHTEVLNRHTETLNQHTQTLNQHTLLLHEHGRRLDALEQGQIGLRQTLIEYHASVLGHGILISELEDRVRRIERHLSLPPAAA